MMFQVPAALGLLWLLVQAFAETEISSKETHQVYSYTYHFQHNGSADPKQFLQNFLPDPPEGGSAVRTFFNPNLRGFISKGYLPAGPANTNSFRTAFPRTPNLPTFEGIKNLVDQNLRNGFQQQPPTPEFAPLPQDIEKNIADIRNDISNSLLQSNGEHQNNVNAIRSVFPEAPTLPVVQNPILQQHRPPSVTSLIAPVPPPLPPPPPPPVLPQVPNDGVVRNVRTFEKNLPNGKVFEKVETYSYNPAPVSNFVSDGPKHNVGERRNQQVSNHQNQQGFGYRSTSYFRKEFRTGNHPSEISTNNDLGDVNDVRNNVVPWKDSPQITSNNNNGGGNVNDIHPVQPLKLLIIPAFDNINKFTGEIRENVNAIEIRPQNALNKPNPANNVRSQGGFGLRLRKPVIATLQNQQPIAPAQPSPIIPQNIQNIRSNLRNSQSHEPALNSVQFNQPQQNNHKPPNNNNIQPNINQQVPNLHQHQPNHHQRQLNLHQQQKPNLHQQQKPNLQQQQKPNLRQQQPNLHKPQQHNLHQQQRNLHQPQQQNLRQPQQQNLRQPQQQNLRQPQQQNLHQPQQQNLHQPQQQNLHQPQQQNLHQPQQQNLRQPQQQNLHQPQQQNIHQPQQQNIHQPQQQNFRQQHQQPNLHQQQHPNLHQPNRLENSRAIQNFNNVIPNVFRNDFTERHPNEGHRGVIGNVDFNGHNADRVVQNVNNKLRTIDEELNSISRSKPDSGSALFWDDGDREWNPFPKMEWGNRLTTRNQGGFPDVRNDRPFSNGHSGPNKVHQFENNDGDTHTMDILRHTLEALVGRKLDIPVIPATDRNSGGVQKVFASDRIVEGPNSYSRDQRSGIERNFQVNSNVGYERSNQWSTDTARKLDTQSSRDDFRRDYIDVFAEDI